MKANIEMTDYEFEICQDFGCYFAGMCGDEARMREEKQFGQGKKYGWYSLFGRN